MTEAYEKWSGLTVRRPSDIPSATPLSWVFEKHTHGRDLLWNAALPARFTSHVRGTAGDALSVLALEESIRREMVTGRAWGIRRAMEMGATWSEVAAALDTFTTEARECLQTYADAQRNLYTTMEEEGIRPFGFTAEQYAAMVALIALPDDVPTGQTVSDGGSEHGQEEGAPADQIQK